MPTLSTAEVDRKASRAGSTDMVPVGIARAWLRDRRVFAVEAGGAGLFPAFQFDAGGQPRAVIREILAALPGDRNPWQIAVWFVSANGWLEGAYPCERLGDREAVAAARRLTEGAVG